MTSLGRSAAAAILLISCFACEGSGEEDGMEAVKHLVEELNKGLPAMADAGTRLNRVSLEGKELLYDYEMLNYTSAELPRAQLDTVLGPQVRKAACGSPQMKPLWKNGYSAHYRYNGKDKRLITEIVVKPSDCGLTSIEPKN
jgi:hypothetical protein